jgi:hypothetical protein
MPPPTSWSANGRHKDGSLPGHRAGVEPIPPSIVRSWPVTTPELEEAKNEAPLTMSTGSRVGLSGASQVDGRSR